LYEKAALALRAEQTFPRIRKSAWAGRMTAADCCIKNCVSHQTSAMITACIGEANC